MDNRIYKRIDGVIFKHVHPKDEFMQVLTIKGEWKNSPIRHNETYRTSYFKLIGVSYYEHH